MAASDTVVGRKETKKTAGNLLTEMEAKRAVFECPFC